MEDEFNNDKSKFLDYVKHYTFAGISLIGAVSCLSYGFVKEEPSFIIGGLGALSMASVRGINGYTNLRELKRLRKENKGLKSKNKKLEKKLGARLSK